MRKDYSIDEVLPLCPLEAQVAEILGFADLQPSLEQLSASLFKDGLVVDEVPFS